MARKSNKGRNRLRRSAEQAGSSESSLTGSSSTVQANGDTSVSPSNETVSEVKEQDNGSQQHPTKQAAIHLYPVSLKTEGGEKLELQLSPGDSGMDVKQFLLDAPETCFLTCYDLLLHTKDGSVHQLEDYNQISEVGDITNGNCFLEMIAASYDDWTIRAHVHRTRELLLPSTLHSSVSTMLALHHESGKIASANSGDGVKAEVLELDNLSFMENVTGSLTKLFSSPSKEIKCVKSIVFSSFNPPPSYRRLSGDLIYLDVVTLEGSKYCITGTTKAFYVNSSTGDILDPRPSRTAAQATSLVGLLQKTSPKFKKAFCEILERKASENPFERDQSLLRPNSWLGLYPVPDHERDEARAENSLTLTLGSELMPRDWNEELQECREIPHATHQERIIRDKALYRVTSEFVDAATSGAIGVINRCIPPINPTDLECFHLYLNNNIFFTFAVDADLEQLLRKEASGLNSKVQTTASAEKLDDNLPEGVSRVSYVDENAASNMEDINNSEALSSDLPAEAQLAENDKTTYARANNDLKGTKAYQEADVPGLYHLAMAIIDYRGHRVVAQSVLPGILYGNNSCSVRCGSADNDKKICWNEDFHSKALEAAKRLHLKEHAVLDGSGDSFKFAASVECKGILGSDDRQYLLDLKATPRDANYDGPGSRFCILRRELISAFCHAEGSNLSRCGSPSEQNNSVVSGSLNVDSAEVLKADKLAPSVTSDTQGAEEFEKQNLRECCSHSDVKDTSKEILFNLDVFTEFKLGGNQEEITADEENVRKASAYLKDVVLPKFIQDLCTLEVSPMDGQTLTEALHANGINVRYIGKVADGTRHMPHLYDLCSNEIVVRSAKHILKEILRDTEDHDLGHAISHFFNCFVGKVQSACVNVAANSSHPKTLNKVHSGCHVSGTSTCGQTNFRYGGHARKKESLFLSITSDSLWSDIQQFAKLKYQFELPEEAKQQVKKIPVIRNLCQKVGITIAARKYDFDALAPFQVSDVLNVQPVVKHCIPVCSEAKDLVETGKAHLAEGMLSDAYALFSEALMILQQVTGPMHREVAKCCRYLAMVHYRAGDMAGAILQQQKELIINEHCLGLDHPDTAHSYENMALFYHGLNQTELALRHMSRSLFLLGLSSGPDHPDVAATFINIAMMYQDLGRVSTGTALRYLQEALKKNERLLGQEHIHTAMCYHALAIAFDNMGAYKLSQQHEKKTYDILVKQLGEDDSRTKESLKWMTKFRMSELQIRAKKQSHLMNTIDILKANPELIQAFQAAVSSSTSSANKSSNGRRGVDGRAARAAAEMRKKAAAGRLLTRPPVQALPPVTGVLNTVNSGMTPDGINIDELQKAENVRTSKADQQDETPVGLGLGSTPLDAKERTKDKDAS